MATKKFMFEKLFIMNYLLLCETYEVGFLSKAYKVGFCAKPTKQDFERSLQSRIGLYFPPVTITVTITIPHPNLAASLTDTGPSCLGIIIVFILQGTITTISINYKLIMSKGNFLVFRQEQAFLLFSSSNFYLQTKLTMAQLLV